MTWPVHFPPADDELLSSWMVRLAHANWLRSEGLVTHLLGHARPVWNRDVDRSAPPDLLRVLAHVSDGSLSRLQTATLHDFERDFSDGESVGAVCPGITAVGVFHRTRLKKGLAYCPRCLAGEQPFFRKAWRVSYVCICSTHACVLLDSCPRCDGPVIPHRADRMVPLSRRTLAHCHQCGFDLGCAEAVATSPSLTASTRLVEEALLVGGVHLGDRPVCAAAFFLGVRSMLVALGRSAGRQRSAKNIDHSPLSERRQAMEVLGPWLRDWPQRFLEDAVHMNLSTSDFALRSHKLPYWLDSVLRDRMLSKPAELTQQEIRAAFEQVLQEPGRWTFARLPESDATLHGGDLRAKT